MLKKLKQNEFALNVSKLLTGTALGQLITVLVSPVLTRLYSADDFGVLAVYFSVASILSVAITLRFEMAILLPDNDEEAFDLVILGTLTALVLSLLLFPFFSVFKIQISKMLDDPDVGNYLLLIPFSTFFYGGFQVLSYWYSRKSSFSDLAISKTVKEACTALIQLGMGFAYKAGALGLIAGQILGNAGGSILLMKKTYRLFRERFQSDLFQNLKAVLIKYKRFPLYSGWAALINAFSQNIPAILLAILYSPAIAGFYAVATRVLTAPSILIGNSVRQVYYQNASVKYNQGQNIFSLFNKTTVSLALIGIIPLILILIWGEPLFGFVFGKDWAEAGTYASILSIWLFFGFINPPAVINLFIFELNRLQLIYEMMLLIFRIVSILAGFWLYQDVRSSLIFFALTGILFQIWLIGYTYFYLLYKKADQKDLNPE